jgi:hypothetical protein
MSHFSRIITSIRDLGTLQLVLTEFNISWEKKNLPISNVYHGQFFELSIYQSNMSGIGFVFNGQEYEFVIDQTVWKIFCTVEIFINRIIQTYTSKLLKNELKNFGFIPVKYIKIEDGIIDLIVEKWLLSKWKPNSRLHSSIIG